jgi:hypothetical protein
LSASLVLAVNADNLATVNGTKIIFAPPNERRGLLILSHSSLHQSIVGGC